MVNVFFVKIFGQAVGKAPTFHGLSLNRLSSCGKPFKFGSRVEEASKKSERGRRRRKKMHGESFFFGAPADEGSVVSESRTTVGHLGLIECVREKNKRRPEVNEKKRGHGDSFN